MTYDGSHDAEKKVAAAFVRRSVSGRLELYAPEIYQSAQRDMRQTMQHALDNVKINRLLAIGKLLGGTSMPFRLTSNQGRGTPLYSLEGTVKGWVLTRRGRWTVG